MPGVFYQRTDYGFSVEILSAKETEKEPFILGVFREDIQRLTDSLAGDLGFTRMLVELGVEPMPENISRIAEIILCHDTRCKARHYGIVH